MCPDDGTVDHVGRGVALHHLAEGFEHRVEDPGLDPSSIASENTVPFAILVRQVTPLRACPRHPHHSVEIASVILRRGAPTPELRRQ